MKTSSISLRVADFLQKYPPFQYLSQAELLRLAQGGRVKFHEADEIIFSAGEERGRYVRVIQRGTVNLYSPNDAGEELIDVRVEGDLVGLEWESPDVAYRATARVAQESILYALPADTFMELCRGNAEASAFLSSYFTIKDEAQRAVTRTETLTLDESAASWLTHSDALAQRASNRLLLAAPEEPIRQVAARIAPGMQEGVVVIDEEARPIGVLTEADLSSRVATGEVSPDAPVTAIMTSPVVTVAPGTTAGDVVMVMMRERRHHVIVTDNGETDGRVVGIIGEKTVQAVHGSVPVFLSKEFTLATDVWELQRLRDRADDLLLRFIEGEAPIEWMTNFIAQVDRMLTEQAIELARAKLREKGLREPTVRWAWVALHSEGRKERLLRSAQRTGIIYDDPAAEKERLDLVLWFSELGNEVGAMLSMCRFPLDPWGRMASNPQWCASIKRWSETFADWVQRPRENNIHNRTAFFDLRAVTGDRSLVDELREAIEVQITRSSSFVPRLVEDAIAHLPPVTVFRDSVLDASGEVTDTFNTKTNALLPLVDIGRVFALSLGLSDATFTPDRFRKAAELLPEYAGVFEDAVKAFDHALKLQTRVGLKRGDNARLVRPDELTPIETQRLKSIFRTVGRLIEVTTKHFDLKPVGRTDG
ncbi:DUF294 nucleotidyltransferase-like domain-containing protein [Actomonas aquatica]|uniref:DUF294 nucleotidyltransferase-like domain-containing protein n=1 Tax=Actomonas aquatica TaxID=2866162 RepID=A0ABZ1C3B0_9BACT|nr:DUF294 nucleotidyltransferase-like domain-containing protein [Opitutus sp. WL0086]WRQ85837.1 DUF294 nucleotidyltransferase-like domain-containing protein [Opitutus sp. WL0086]